MSVGIAINIYFGLEQSRPEEEEEIHTWIVFSRRGPPPTIQQ